MGIRAVLDCGVDNGSHSDRNIMFDPVQKKCYIIDFERSSIKESHKGSEYGADLHRWIYQAP
ncbi:hypothetical protein AC579_4698 [Pseudocercospora musae]|uniref:Uncharacterized protein n=1 Tax=Pseudocercospora musae TaxID=113226 RepID=A0A139IBC2_9PEZI|nr:hypothetical protein AC579_4698 [Pseudocercospora musae]